MPLRDHFRPPLDDLRHWEGFHATWPVMIVAQLRRQLPHPYFAEPRIHLGSSAEIAVATYEKETDAVLAFADGNGGIATAVWAPPRPTQSIVTDLPAQDEYEVLVFDEKRHCRLVAAIGIVSPANKDRPEHRRAFVSKCAGMLREQVSVTIIDIVTTRTQDLYRELLDHIGQSGPGPPIDSSLYANACRMTKRASDWVLETWAHSLVRGQPLPTLPLWLADNLALPLALEESYEQSCTILNIP